ncbi:MAG: hypothetical protein ABIC91_01200 [Nanoarchaeota archaeon]|nr:hypothetical protein [Nanoarchaeota archaeon]MBU1029821.1 hypothetical protein [Nanoarchaeota archaeon]MBU1849652.1 hypothetical protein [Nanoarchaeota archaeon]
MLFRKDLEESVVELIKYDMELETENFLRLNSFSLRKPPVVIPDEDEGTYKVILSDDEVLSLKSEDISNILKMVEKGKKPEKIHEVIEEWAKTTGYYDFWKVDHLNSDVGSIQTGDDLRYFNRELKRLSDFLENISSKSFIKAGMAYSYDESGDRLDALFNELAAKDVFDEITIADFKIEYSVNYEDYFKSLKPFKPTKFFFDFKNVYMLIEGLSPNKYYSDSANVVYSDETVHATAGFRLNINDEEKSAFARIKREGIANHMSSYVQIPNLFIPHDEFETKMTGILGYKITHPSKIKNSIAAISPDKNIFLVHTYGSKDTGYDSLLIVDAIPSILEDKLGELLKTLLS